MNPTADLHERPVGADDEVGFAVLVDEARRRLEPLPLPVFGLQPVGDQTRRSRLQHCQLDRNEFECLIMCRW